VARVLAISSDLLLGSKVAPLDGTDLIVADLDAEDATALVGHGVPVLGYYSHVDVETKQRAETAGIDLAVPRSRMARELPELAAKLLEG